MERESDTCAHGSPIGDVCGGLCEHGVRCGKRCNECDREYRELLGEFCDRLGEGDRERGRRVAIEILKEGRGA